MPPLDQALARLATELEAARLQGVRVLTLIHGYGSSGAGGVIRGEVRHQLESGAGFLPWPDRWTWNGPTPASPWSSSEAGPGREIFS